MFFHAKHRYDSEENSQCKSLCTGKECLLWKVTCGWFMVVLWHYWASAHSKEEGKKTDVVIC